MLEEVRISGLGVIEAAVMEFSPGFNVVTGETGAGKTMVVTGLGLLFGGRADPARVRPGAERAAVDGRLRLDPDGPIARHVSDSGGDLDEDGGTLLLSRSVSAEGRSRAFAGGRSVSVSLLTYLADDLVAVHGQADQQQLLKPGRQRAALDRFAGPELAALLTEYKRAYSQHKEVRAELDDLVTRAKERAREAEDLRHGLGEIERAEPVAGEDIELAAEAERLANADELHAAATTAHEALRSDPTSGSYDSADALTLLAAARQALEAAGRHDPALATLATRIGEAAYLLADAAAELASYADSIDADPALLAQVLERRAELTRLIRAYGAAPVPRPSRPAKDQDRTPRGENGPSAGLNRETLAQPGGVAAAPAPGAPLAAGAGSATPGPAGIGGPGVAGSGPAGEAGASAGPGPAAEADPGSGPAGEADAGPGPDPAAASLLNGVLEWAAGAAERLAELAFDDDRIGDLERQEAELAARVAELGAGLTAARQQASARFEQAVTAELTALAMPHAQLRAVVSQLSGGYGPDGGDDVEIRLAAHPGAPSLPLHKGASGGELSRVMLAIEVVFAGADPVPTFVFDEVDAGVGGKAAVEIGRRLARLARQAQVIVVTHLPQVAAFADAHMVVEKSTDGSIVASGITRLDEAGRVRELSRMLAGLEDSEFGRAHASELLAAAAAERTGASGTEGSPAVAPGSA